LNASSGYPWPQREHGLDVRSSGRGKEMAPAASRPAAIPLVGLPRRDRPSQRFNAGDQLPGAQPEAIDLSP
jgi:hypothetical protein